MTRILEFDGKDLDEALRAASAALSRPVEALDYTLLEGGRKGVFGLGARPVRIRVALPDEPAPAAPPRPRPPLAAAPAPAPVPPREEATSAPARMLRTMLELAGLRLEVSESRRDGRLEILLDGADRKRLAANGAELVEALETVLNRMGRRGWPDEPPVRLAAAGAAKSRDHELVALVREVADHVGRSGEPRNLGEMNPYERRIVHMTVRAFPGLTSVSEGSGFLKRVRVEKIGS